MEERGNLAEPELKRQLREFTYGFSPLSLSEGDPRYNRFSFPTKFITYLAAGLPVITLGHPSSSVIKMAAAYQVGPIITTSTSDQIAAILHRELTQPAPWDRHRGEMHLTGLEGRTGYDRVSLVHAQSPKDLGELREQGASPGSSADASHTRAVLSSDAVATRVPSALNATAHHEP